MTLDKNIRDFLTIRKEFYNFWLWAMSEKVFRYYQGNYMPPTYNYVKNPANCEVLPPVEKTLWLTLSDIPDNIREQFKENIEIQEQVLSAIKKRNEEFHYRCWLIQLKTGKGKSHVIIDVVNYYQTPTLILVHNVKTLWEMREKFVQFSNITPAIYGWGKKEIGKITIMTKKSFANDSENIQQKFWLVIIDEAPVWFSKKLWNSLNKFFHKQEWVALYGLSWTPYKNDLEQKDLEKYFGLTIQVKNEYNIIPEFTFFDYYAKSRYEYETPAEMRGALADDRVRLEKQLEKIWEVSWNCTLILTDRKQEALEFQEYIWCWSFLMTGDTKQKDDEENIEHLKTLLKKWEKVAIIGTIQKCWTGMDLPFIDSIFLASAIKFKATVIQSIGRALRKYEGKEKVNVYIWNDLPILKKQRTEKIKIIKSEYGVTKINAQKV